MAQNAKRLVAAQGLEGVVEVIQVCRGGGEIGAGSWAVQLLGGFEPALRNTMCLIVALWVLAPGAAVLVVGPEKGPSTVVCWSDQQARGQQQEELHWPGRHAGHH